MARPSCVNSVASPAGTSRPTRSMIRPSAVAGSSGRSGPLLATFGKPSVMMSHGLPPSSVTKARRKSTAVSRPLPEPPISARSLARRSRASMRGSSGFRKRLFNHCRASSVIKPARSAWTRTPPPASSGTLKSPSEVAAVARMVTWNGPARSRTNWSRARNSNGSVCPGLSKPSRMPAMSEARLAIRPRTERSTI